ncbi:hypothetical protein mRhiFer1_009430 [Rhinolophus ferrumequinum]|uniref:Uncharacterized protein n=1 Tax=Rhinolophus ferrumequinum TaxID=59479 RepID=A0A7J7RJD1_RHIFE|nr:hypothetical protein mRhiFer1_009430 [Rhinolophus ferrumequinum]
MTMALNKGVRLDELSLARLKSGTQCGCGGHSTRGCHPGDLESSASFLPLYYILFLQERHSQPEVFRLPLQEAPRELLGALSFNQACFHSPFRLKVTFRIHQCNSSPSPSESGVFSLSCFKS